VAVMGVRREAFREDQVRGVSVAPRRRPSPVQVRGDRHRNSRAEGVVMLLNHPVRIERPDRKLAAGDRILEDRALVGVEHRYAPERARRRHLLAEERHYAPKLSRRTMYYHTHPVRSPRVLVASRRRRPSGCGMLTHMVLRHMLSGNVILIGHDRRWPTRWPPASPIEGRG
jgi:hypothetical protein